MYPENWASHYPRLVKHQSYRLPSAQLLPHVYYSPPPRLGSLLRNRHGTRNLPVGDSPGDYVVAVGTTITGRPPHRSVRALSSAHGSYLGSWRRSVVLAFRTLDRKSTRLNSSHLG